MYNMESKQNNEEVNFMLFTPAEVLRESFEVYGKFYKYHIDGRSLKMRGQAKILRKDADTEHADCIVIMINPGSRTPSETYVYPSHQEKLTLFQLNL